MSLITWNPNDKGDVVFLSNNNLTASIDGRMHKVRATVGKTTGRWYWEFIGDKIGAVVLGISNKKASLTYWWTTKGYYSQNGNKIDYDVLNVGYGNRFTTGDNIGVALDLDSGTIEFYKNGVSQGIAFNDILNVIGLGELFPSFSVAASAFNAGGTVTANFGATPFKYPIPRGHLPYDVDNADWYNPISYLFQCNDNILKPTMNGLELVGGVLNKELFEEYGTEYLPDIIGQYDKQVDMIYKENLGDKKLYGYKLVGYRNIDRLEVK